MKVTRRENRGRREIEEDGVELSIVTVDILKAAAAAATSIPILGSAAGIVSCILQQISQAQQNTELALRIAARCARALVTISEHLNTLKVTPEILNNIKYFVADLHEVQDFIEKETNSNRFYLILFAKKRIGRLQDLQLRVQDTIGLFQITTLITLRDIIQRHSSSLERGILEIRDAVSGQGGLRRMSKDEPESQTDEEFDIVPEEELFVRNGFRLHLAKVSGKCAIVKVFEGEHAQKNYGAAVEFEKHLVHPHLLRLKHISRSNTPTPFIVYHQDVQGTAEQFIAGAIPSGIFSIFVAGAQMVSGIASGLSHLHLRGIPLHSIGIDNFSIFINGAKKAVLSFDDFSPVSVASGQFEDHTGIDILGHLCHHTFNAANEISSSKLAHLCCGHLAQSFHYTGDTPALGNESESSFSSDAGLVDAEEKGQTNRVFDASHTVTPTDVNMPQSHGEETWEGTGGSGNIVTLDNISYRFKKALSSLSSASRSPKHSARSIREFQTASVGDSKGYRPEKVVFEQNCLGARNAAPLYEKCLICGRDVNGEIFRCKYAQPVDRIPIVNNREDNDDGNKSDFIHKCVAGRTDYRSLLNNLVKVMVYGP